MVCSETKKASSDTGIDFGEPITLHLKGIGDRMGYVRCSPLFSSQHPLATTGIGDWMGNVRCAVFDGNLHPRIPLRFTTLLHVKLLHACDQWHSSRKFNPLTGFHCKLRPNTEGC
jgi:hypothetical protein